MGVPKEKMKLKVLLLRPSDATETLPELQFYELVVVTETDLQNEDETPQKRFFRVLARHNPVAIYSVCSTSDFYKHFGFVNTMPYSVVSKWVHLDAIGEFRENMIPHTVFTVVKGHPYAKNNPLMSIITSTFHSGDKILRPLTSLLAQTYNNWEWIIWDDSKDESMWPRLQELAESDFRIKVFRPRQHSGYIGDMKRLASSVATGDWIVEIDHDDEFDKHLLEWIVTSSKAHPSVEFIYTDSSEVYEDSKLCHNYGDFFAFGFGSHVNIWHEDSKRWFTSAMTQGPNPRTLKHIVGVPNHVRAWKTSFYNRIGKHNSTLPVADDYELLLRSFLHGKWLHIPVCAYFQYRNANGNNFTFLRNELIQHASAWIWDKYADDVQKRFQQLGIPLESAHPYVPVWKLETDMFPTLETTWLPEPFNVSTTISIVVPTFDRADLLVRALRSVCAQTDPDWILFVVGDMCPTLEATMNTLEHDATIRPHLHRIHWWNLTEHSGKWGAVSRNFGLRMLAKTDWVTYLDDDNEWASTHLSVMRKTASAHPSAQAVFSSMMVEGKPIVCKRAVFGRVDASGFLHKRALAAKYGFWPMEKATYANDWTFVERWVKAGVTFAFTHQPTLLYNTSTNSQTFDSILALANDAEPMVEKQSVQTLASLPASIQLAWSKAEESREHRSVNTADKPLDIALSFNDRYVGFFEPFGHDMDAVLVDDCVFNTDKVNSVTCFMTLRALNPSTTVPNIVLYQTEQLSREMELSRVVGELIDARNRGCRVKVLQYSKFNMKVLNERLVGTGLPIEHVYKPLVTPAHEVSKLKKLLRVVQKTDDLAFSCGPSDRRASLVKQLKELGFKVRFIDYSFGQERDVGVASCKVLLNIHAAEDFRVFETSRCLRWLDAGHTVITEESEDLQEYLDTYPNLIMVPFASISKGQFGLSTLKPAEHNWIEDIISSAWKGHRRFAEWLVHRTKPKVIVDLGVDFGYSTFVWATAGAEHGTEVFGIDMFEGDPQTGVRNTFDAVKKTAADHKLDNLTVLRADFASVAQLWCRFVDILHIDGFHSFEAVSSDFANWSPHVGKDGVILFHDTAVQEYQVKDFFATLPKDHCFEFFHSFGLGVYTKNKELLHEIRNFKL